MSPPRTPEDAFSGGVAVITGGGGGLGAGLAKLTATMGMTVIIADIAYDRAQSVASNIIASGGRAEAFTVDVSEPTDLDKFANDVFSRYGKVRLLINNAGIETLGYISEVSAASWEATLNVNIHGVVHGVRAFLPRMLASGEECWIVNTASLASFCSLPGQTAYATTKHAVQGFTEGLTLELQIQEANIHVSSIIPSLLRTDIFDSNPVPDEPKGADRVQPYRAKLARMAQEKGMGVKEASRIILEQIAKGEFWVLTHPEESKVAMTARARFLELQGNPAEFPGTEGNRLQAPTSIAHPPM
jgi:NAD(P)-dependent dehydrogenase (short-subunit alcohol dehydrogenase family)